MRNIELPSPSEQLAAPIEAAPDTDTEQTSRERAQRMGEAAAATPETSIATLATSVPEVAEAPESPEARFNVDPEDFTIFAQQGEFVDCKLHAETLNINETLGRMVGSTAATIAALTGEDEGIPAAEHVIYLDKSARPVSWLVNEFWDDFTDCEQPSASYLAIDRIDWFRRIGLELDENQYIKGTDKLADERDFDITKVPRSTLAGIRALYIDGGIESDDLSDENIEKIMSTPTTLDGKDITIIDEVSRSGATLGIARKLLLAAIPEAKSVNGYTFWKPGIVINESGETQMKSAPAWYPQNKRDWRGRGVRDVDISYYADQYNREPTNENRAKKFGAFVLGVPMTEADLQKEPEQLSLKLMNEVRKMHEEYQKGHILPSTSALVTESRKGKVLNRMLDQMESWGVEFAPKEHAENPSRTYVALAEKRDDRSRRPRQQ